MTLPPKTSKQLGSLRAFLSEDPVAITIVQICDLLPTSDWRKWKSRFGTKLQATKARNLMLRPGHGIGPPELFQNQTIDQILSFTKLVSYSQDKYLLSWGEDDRIRVFEFQKVWKRICPLSVGLLHLRDVVRFENVEVEDGSGYQSIDGGFISWLPIDNSKLESTSWKANLACLTLVSSNSSMEM